jgi:hypothetical protein
MNKLTKSEAGKLGAIVFKKNTVIRMKERIEEYNKDPTLCKHCNNSIDYLKRKNIFCSHPCSGTFTGLEKGNRKIPLLWNCLFCNVEYPIIDYKFKTFCSHTCQQEYKSSERLNAWKLTGKIDGRTNTPGWIKNYILEKQEYRCADCGIKEWNNKSIVLELEHKDGNSDNNLEDNLCCICPNCHSQTSTYKAKNKGNGRHRRRKLYAEGKSY